MVSTPESFPSMTSLPPTAHLPTPSTAPSTRLPTRPTPPTRPPTRPTPPTRPPTRPTPPTAPVRLSHLHIPTPPTAPPRPRQPTHSTPSTAHSTPPKAQPFVSKEDYEYSTPPIRKLEYDEESKEKEDSQGLLQNLKDLLGNLFSRNKSVKPKGEESFMLTIKSLNNYDFEIYVEKDITVSEKINYISNLLDTLFAKTKINLVRVNETTYKIEDPDVLNNSIPSDHTLVPIQVLKHLESILDEKGKKQASSHNFIIYKINNI